MLKSQMIRRVIGFAAATGTALIVTITTALADPPTPSGTGTVKTTAGNGSVEVSIGEKSKDDPGGTGQSGDSGATDSESTNDQSQGVSTNPCWSETASFPAGDPHWQGHTTADGYVLATHCPHSTLNPGTPDGQEWSTQYEFVANGETPGPPPVTTDEIQDEAMVDATSVVFKAGLPAPHIGPDRSRIAVKIPVWLWIDDPGPIITTSAPLRDGSTITITATVAGTDWSMGEPYNLDPGAAIQTTHCDGPGSPPPAATPDRSVTPPCGYTYWWKSTAERTGGKGSWPISVTASWQVTWTVTSANPDLDGLTNTEPIVLTSQPATDALPVGEYTTVLVAPTR